MGCGGRAKRPDPPAEVQPQTVLGEAGLALLYYTGVMDIDTYIGPITGAAYPFGLFRRRGYVDSRDVPGLLQTIEDGLKVFRYVQPDQSHSPA